jgi:hypothetical protein
VLHVFQKESKHGIATPLAACRSRPASPCFGDVRRFRGRSRCDPRRIRAARRVVGRDRVAAPVPRYHRQPAGAGVRARHRRLEAAAATPCQAASAPGALKRSPEMPGGTRLAPHVGPDLDHRFPLTVSAGRAYHRIGGARSASGSFDQSHVQSLPARRLGDKSDCPHAIAPGVDVTSLPLRHVQSLPQTY